MHSEELIQETESFFAQKHIVAKVLYYINKGKPWVKLNFNDISKFSPNLAEELLFDPENTLKGFEIILDNFDSASKQSIRIFNLPNDSQKTIWTLRNQHIGKFLSIKGLVGKISAPEQLCKSVKYECPSCGNLINVLVLGKTINQPHQCGCGRKGRFRLVSREFVDLLKIGVIDDLADPENVGRTITREKICVLEKDLVNEDIDKLISPGKKVIINGYLQCIPKSISKDNSSAEFTSQIICNSVEFPKVGWDVIKINPKTESKIKKFAKESDIIQRLSHSVVDVEGENIAKIACLLQLAGSPHIYNENKQLNSRGTIHLLLIGDPGSAKSTIAKNFGVISPIHSFQTCANASGKGLVASVVKDADIGNWVVYPGVVPMANKGVVVLDEMDKTHQDDYGDHNSAMNDMLVPIAKANVRAVLETQTSYLATANPKYRVFSNREEFYQQIDMPKDLLDRFDVIFPIIATTNEDKREKIMDIILERHSANKTLWKPEFSHEYIRNHIAYCRQIKPNPVIDKKYYPMIKTQLQKLMKPKNPDDQKISFRHMESILRLSYASARLRLDDVKACDINLAFRIKYESFKELGIIDQYGFMNFEIDAGVPIQERDNYEKFKTILEKFIPDSKTECDIQTFIEECVKQGIKEEDVEKFLQDEFDKRDYFEPRKGMLMKLE